MNKILTIVAFAFAAVIGRAADPAAPAGEADQAYAELRTVRMTQVPRMADVAAASALQMKQHDEASRLAEKFLTHFPNDPRKWEVMAWAVNSPRTLGPDASAWNKRRDELRDELLAGKDVPDTIWVGVAERYADDLDGFRGVPVKDLAKAGGIVEQLAARLPGSDRRRFVEEAYIDALTHADPVAAEAFLRRRASAAESNSAVRELAGGHLRVIEAARAPLDLKFTAADGREVDLEKMRGKVVLIDFWATWCVPCMEEMPTVRAAYQKYHDRGFEVIGIAFENSRLTKTDTAEVIAQKKQAAKDKLLKFVGEKTMPWPHHFDGEYWNNEFGRRFAIASIPTAFLIGKDGRLITTDTHGEKLEAGIKQALNL